MSKRSVLLIVFGLATLACGRPCSALDQAECEARDECWAMSATVDAPDSDGRRCEPAVQRETRRKHY